MESFKVDTEPILREVGKLHARLFDHRAFVNAEARQFIHEFETKRAKRADRGLDASLIAIEDMNQTQFPHASMLIDDGTPKLMASLQVGTRMIDKIAEKQSTDQFDHLRRQKRKERELAWNAFMEDLCSESNMIEEDYEDSKKKMLEFYDQLNGQMKQ